MTATRPSHDEPIAAQASAWLVRVHGDTVSESDWTELEDWLAESDANRAAYGEAELLWSALDDQRDALLERLNAPSGAGVADLSAHRNRRRVSAPWGWAATASALALAAAAALLIDIPAPAASYHTEPGEKRTVTLEDGSTIAMNGGSTLSVRYSRNRRLVTMGSAEASFNVAHTPGRPFVVEVGRSEVSVIGTAFNIQRDAASTRVAVERGVVEVRDQGSPETAVRLTVGEAMRRDDLSPKPIVFQVDPQAVFGWRTGRVIYSNQPLEGVAEDLSRAFKIPVEVAPETRSVQFTGVLAFDDEDAVLRRLTTFLPISSYRVGDHYELKRR